MNKWDGKTKGNLLGYRFFVFCIQFFGLNVAYFFCFFVALYFILFAKKERNAIVQFNQTAFGLSKWKAYRLAFKNFNQFGQILIDRIALKTKLKSKFSFQFNNEDVLIRLKEEGKGAFLFSAHIGNWENAGNLLSERISDVIHILMLDQEYEKIKRFLESQTEKQKFNVIPLKDDMSHFISIHQALKNKEFIALHADRTLPNQRVFQLPFLNGFAEFPAGPFQLVKRFDVPLCFVFAVKKGKRTYELSAQQIDIEAQTPEQIAQIYVSSMEELIQKNPSQWFNYFPYYVS